VHFSNCAGLPHGGANLASYVPFCHGSEALLLVSFVIVAMQTTITVIFFTVF
jgi:hypothetical protein